MGTMLVIGVLGTILYSFRKILECSENSDLERLRIQNKYRIDRNRLAAAERVAHHQIQVSRDIVLMKQNIALLEYIKSTQEIAFLSGKFEESLQLRSDYDGLRRKLSAKYGENSIRYLESKK